MAMDPHDSRSAAIKFDDIMDGIGGFGKYQLLLVVMVCLGGATSGAYIALLQFLFARPVDFTCESWNLGANVTLTSAQICHLKSINPCTNWSYTMENLPLKNTIITEWDMYCTSRLVITATETGYFACVAIGVVLISYFSDKLGRRKLLLLSIIGRMMFGFLSTTAPSFGFFVLFRWINGFFVMSSYTIAYVLALELLGTKYRIVARVVQNFYYDITMLLLGILALQVLDWRILQLCIIVVDAIVLFFLLWMCPESPRWSAINNEMDDALHILRNIANSNRKDSSDLPWQLLELNNNVPSSGNVFPSLYRNRLINQKSFTVGLIWFVNGLVYWGLLLNVKNFIPYSTDSATSSDNPGRERQVVLIIFMIGTLIFRDFLLMPSVNLFGRKIMHTTSWALATIALLFAAAMPGAWKTFFGTIALVCVSYALSINYIRTSEIYCTNSRTAAIGYGCFASRVGSMFFPFIHLTFINLPWAETTVYSLFACAGTLLVFSLPETSGEDLPTTQEEANRLDVDWSFIKRSRGRGGSNNLSVLKPDESANVKLLRKNYQNLE